MASDGEEDEGIQTIKATSKRVGIGFGSGKACCFAHSVGLLMKRKEEINILKIIEEKK